VGFSRTIITRVSNTGRQNNMTELKSRRNIMKTNRSRIAIALLAVLSPIGALADITDQTVSVPVGQQLNLETGAAVASGGDLKWDGLILTPQNGAAVTVGGASDADYQSLTLATLQTIKSAGLLIPGVPLALGSLAGHVVIVGIDSASHFYKAEVLNTQGTQNQTLQLKLTVYGANGTGGGSGPPTITKILNNYSLIPNGFVNSGVAPSTLFVAMGSNMSDPPPASGLTLNSTAAPGLPSTSAGANANIAAGGKNFPIPLYYASPTQIAGVIPAAVPPGPATITVTYKGQTSSPFSFTVVANALGLGTYQGVIIATDATTGALITYTNTAKPGQNLVFWGSGGGADPSDPDNLLTGSPHSVNQSGTQFYFGSKQGTVLYSGSSGYPALMQMNVTVPQNTDLGCGVTVVGIVNGVPSNFGPLPIDPSGVCHDPIFGLSGTDIANAGNSKTVKSGSFFVGSFVQPTGTSNIASANFSSNTGSGYVSGGFTSFGSCSVSESLSGSSNSTSTPLDVGSVQLLDANNNAVTLQSLTKGSYFAQLGAAAIVAGGTYKFTVAGGADGGAGSISFPLPNPLLTPTNVPTTIDHTQSLSTSWTGGAAGSYVLITGSSTNTSTGVTGSFTCWAPQSALGFVVPQPVVSILPAGSGTLSFENATLPVRGNLASFDQVFGFGVTLNSSNVTVK
jgi:uncharacterized protein (TIGR03437 family)